MRQEYYVNLGLMRKDYDDYIKSFEKKEASINKLQDTVTKLQESLHKFEVNIAAVNILVGIVVTAVISFSVFLLRESIIDSK